MNYCVWNNGGVDGYDTLSEDVAGKVGRQSLAMALAYGTGQI